jgi:YVTN family beta-propeller protein
MSRPARSRFLTISSALATSSLVGGLLSIGAALAPAAHAVTTVSIPVGAEARGVTIDTKTHEVFVTNFDDDTISVISQVANTVIKTIKVGGAPVGIAADSKRGVVYALVAHKVAVINVSTNKVTRSISLGHTGGDSVAIDESKDLLFVTEESTNQVAIVSGSSHKVLKQVKTGNLPVGVAVDQSKHNAFVTVAGSDEVEVISATHKKVTHKVKVQTEPNGISIDPKRHEVYVVNQNEVFGNHSTVSVISTRTIKVVATIKKTGEQGGSAAVDTKNGVLYVSQDGSYTVYEINLRTRKVIGKIRFGAADIDVNADAIDSKAGAGYFLNDSDYGAAGVVQVLKMHKP